MKHTSKKTQHHTKASCNSLMIAAWSSVGAIGTAGSDCFPFTRFNGAGFGDGLSAGFGDAACLLPLAESLLLGVALLFAAAAVALGLGFAFSLAEGFFFEASSSSAVACSPMCIVLYCTSGSFSKLRMFFRMHK